MTFGSVLPPLWSEVWIIARGPSVHRFDFGRLAGKQVLGVNTFVCALEIPAAICSIDHRWIGSHRALLSAYPGAKYLAVPVDAHPECANITGAVYLERCHEPGLSEDPRALCTGGNSGYAAINVAVLKGAREIHLVGYDMDPAAGEKFALWAPQFDGMLPQLNRLGIKVVNHSMASHISAFPKEP